MTTAVRKIIEEVKALNEAERRELEAQLQSLDGPAATAAAEQEVVRQLAAQGVVTPPTRLLAEAAPVAITGQPVSEIIVAERR